MNIYQVPSAVVPLNATVTVPGSKSQTNRALLLAALAKGSSVVRGALFSDDTRFFLDSLQRLGLQVQASEQQALVAVEGTAGHIPATSAEIYVGNAGTAARFLTAYLPLGHGSYLLDGTTRMRQRPIAELLDTLRALGAKLEAVEGNGCPPVRIQANGLEGGTATVDASRSGQFLSALLMVAPYARRNVELTLAGQLASPPYIEMTLSMMREWGVHATAEADPDGAPRRYSIPAGQHYSGRTYDIAPDASGASYFLAAAAVTGGRVRVHNLGLASEQGDLGFVDVLARMGCSVLHTGADIEVQGPDQLQGIELDLNAMSDMMLTLAAIAPFASGPVTIHNVGHTRLQETDRISAAVTELRRLGARVDERDDGLTIYPSTLHGDLVRTYDDHRVAMAFAITGLRVPKLTIENPECVSKTFPDYFNRLEAALRG